MGGRTVMQEALFYNFSIEDHVPTDHMLRLIDRFVDLGGIREHLKADYSELGRPSIDPELMIRMLIVGYCMGIRSERGLCEEVHLNLAYRWFCRLDLEAALPDHSTFSKNRRGRSRDCDLLRQLFEMTVERCMAEELVGGEGFAVNASPIRADVHRQRSVPGEEGLPPEAVGRAVREYLEVLDDAAFGGATPVTPSCGELAFVGTAITIAEEMQAWLEERGSDGFSVMFPWLPGGLDEVTAGVVPELQRRGIFRKQYEGTTLRDHLGLPRQENRFFAKSPVGVTA